MEKFNGIYGKYPEYPVADAGYGSFNNYLYCEEHGLKKYMKFTMYEKESKDNKRSDYPSGLLLQVVNMKSWITCLSIPAVFVMPYTSEVKYIFIAAGLTWFFMIAATYIWCISGKVLERVYIKYKKPFSVALALSMVYCIVMAVK